MTKIYNKIKINASPDKVWDVLTNLAEVQKYNSGVKSAKYISKNKIGVGASRQCELKPKGTVKERVTKVVPKKFIEMELFESNYPLVFLKWRTEVVPDGRETIVNQILEYKMKYGFLGRLMDALMMRKKFQGVMDEIFVSMKGYIEGKK